MNHADTVELVRELAREELQELGIAQNAPVIETILIRDGQYAGRRFRCGEIHSDWLVGDDQLTFYSPRGRQVTASPISPKKVGVAKAA